MLRNGLARQLISNIPAYMGGINVLPCKGDHKTLVEIIPINSCLVDYHSDTWDFTPGFKYQRRSCLKIRFEKANPEYKNLIKDYTAQLLDSYKCKVSTASNVIASMISMLNYAIENSYNNMFILLDTDDIINAVRDTQKHAGSRREMLSHMMNFTEFIKENHGIVLPIDLEVIGRKMIRLGDAAGYRHQRKHHRNIPEEFFQAIVETSNRVMRDNKEPFNMRMMAGMILIDTQLGLRALEIPALEKDCIFDYTCGDGKIRHYSVYNSIKPAKADVEVYKYKSICTDILYNTWKYMIELRKECMYCNETNLMFIMNHMPNSHTPKDKMFPISQDSLQYNYKVFFGRYLKEYIKKDWKGIEKVKVPNLKDDELYSIPTIHNIRVHFATSLYRQGFPLDFIESIMSHSPQSNTYDTYYDLEDEEYRYAQQTKYKNKAKKHADPEEEFDEFLNNLED